MRADRLITLRWNSTFQMDHECAQSLFRQPLDKHVNTARFNKQARAPCPTVGGRRGNTITILYRKSSPQPQ
jgi:hypothetical protein